MCLNSTHVVCDTVRIAVHDTGFPDVEPLPCLGPR